MNIAIRFRLLAPSFLALAAFAATPSLRAASYTWDPSQSNGTTGGAGAWNTTSSFWTDGASDIPWGTSPTNADTAIFSGATSNNYTVTLAGTLYAGALTFNASSALTLTGGTLFLNGPATISATNTNGSATINSIITGTSGLTKTGSSIVTLSAQNTYIGSTTISTGGITLGISNALTTATDLTVATGAAFNVQGFSQAVNSLVGAGTVRATSGPVSSISVLTIGSPGSTASTAFSGTISDKGATANAVRIALTVAGGTLQLSGTNSYYGATTVSGGTLKLSSSLANTSAVLVNGGTLASTTGVTLGTGAVTMTSGAINPGGTGTTATMTLAALQTFAMSGGSLTFDLGTASDQILSLGAGTFSITGGTFVLTPGTGFNYASAYTLLSGFTSGSVAGLTITGYDTSSYLAALDNTGVLSFSAIAVPEPGAGTFLLAGGLFVLFLRLRRVGTKTESSHLA